MVDAEQRFVEPHSQRSIDMVAGDGGVWKVLKKRYMNEVVIHGFFFGVLFRIIGLEQVIVFLFSLGSFFILWSLYFSFFCVWDFWMYLFFYSE